MYAAKTSATDLEKLGAPLPAFKPSGKQKSLARRCITALFNQSCFMAQSAGEWFRAIKINAFSICASEKYVAPTSQRGLQLRTYTRKQTVEMQSWKLNIFSSKDSDMSFTWEDATMTH